MKITGQRISEFFELETALHKKNVRNSPEAVAELLADEFIEFGSSGRIFDKTTIIEMLKNEVVDLQVTVANFGVRELTPAWRWLPITRTMLYDLQFGSSWMAGGRWFSSGNQNSAVIDPFTSRPTWKRSGFRQKARDPSLAQDFACGLPLRSRPQSGSSYN